MSLVEWSFASDNHTLEGRNYYFNGQSLCGKCAFLIEAALRPLSKSRYGGGNNSHSWETNASIPKAPYICDRCGVHWEGTRIK